MHKRTHLSPTLSAPLTLETLEDRVVPSVDFYSVDGTGNNLSELDWGSTGVQLIRLLATDYGDGISTPAGEDRPSAREVSNGVVAQDASILNERYLTDITWLWGQFIDHDLDLSEGADPAEPFDIEVPAGDPFFDPTGTGTATISLNRTVYDPTSDPRQQINQITAFLDGSMVYGSDQERADALRTFSGGLLKTSDGELLPFNEEGLENAGGTSSDLFLAGDVRANENAALTAMHTLFVREHNRIAGELAAENPALTDEELYQEARSQVIAEIQAITYNEFLPALLGEGAIAAYSGYDPNVDPGISNVFSTASYRLGHSMLSSELLRLNNDGTVSDEGNLALRDAFFAPDELSANGIDSLLLGVTAQQAQEIDAQVIDDVRNFLFGPPGSGGFDLASLNIQRGRDHGLPSYNQARIDLGLDPVTSFADITSDVELQAKLEAVYGSVDDIDLWVGALAEDHVPGASVGELNYTVLVDQFTRIRDGDRLWYENQFSGQELADLQNTTLADIIERNTDITDLRDNVFYTDEVFYYRAEAGAGPLDATLVNRGDTVRLVNNRTGEVLTSGSASELAEVQIVGNDRIDDRIEIDLNGDIDLSAGVQVHGGQRDRDTLAVNGTRRSDEILVGPGTVDVNGNTTDFSDFERLVVRAGDGDDHIEVDPEVQLSISVQGGPGDDTFVGDPRRVDFNGGPGRDRAIDNDDGPPRGPGGHHHGYHHRGERGERGRGEQEHSHAMPMQMGIDDAINVMMEDMAFLRPPRGRRG